jgi:UDP-GlcNAc:undecaprenyl-phosphate/decaprenyl-phosphate GlcNAc-1-phosphate transferase
MDFFSSLIILVLLSTIIGYIILRVVMKMSQRYSILDRPHLYDTERGRRPAPYGIGIAIMMTLLIIAPLIPMMFDISWTLEKKLHIVLILGSVLALVSYIDDLDTIDRSRWRVPPVVRLMMQICVGIIIGITSIKISYISDMFGGVIRLDEYFVQFQILASTYTFYYIPILMTMFWYVLVFNSINFSDGIPGLTWGFSLISFTILAWLAIKLAITDTTLAAQENSQFILILLAILIPITALVTYRDIHRSGIMGDSGTIILAFSIATLAIIAGGKIATAMSVIGIYLIDFVYVIGVRIIQGRNPMQWDQTHHLHYRLLELGFTPGNIRNIIYILAWVFGVAAIFLDTRGKIALFVVIALVTLFMTQILSIVRKK